MAIRISNITATFSNASHRYDGIGFNANVVASAANSTLFHLRNTNITKFAVHLNGDVEVIGGILANNSLGSAGQVLTSNGSSIYWSTPSGGPGGGVTSVGSGDGLTGGPITNTGTLSVLANTGLVANATGLYVNSTYIGTLTANNTSFVGSVSAANVVSNAQLSANLAAYQTIAGMSSYQTTAGLSANVATLTANNTSFVGSVSAANVVSNAQLQANLAAYQTTAGMSSYQTTAGLSANVATLAANSATYVLANNGIVSNSSGVFVRQGTGTVVNATGVHVNSTYIGTLTANNTSFVGSVSAANVVSNAQLSGNLGNYVAKSGSTMTGNLTPNSNTVNLGNTIQRWVLVANTGDFSGAVNAISFGTTGVSINATHVAPASNSSGINWGITTARPNITANNGTFSEGLTSGALTRNAIGVTASSNNSYGVYGQSNASIGVYGVSNSSYAGFFNSTNYHAIIGISSNSNFAGGYFPNHNETKSLLAGYGNYAAYGTGDAHFTGALSKGSGTFFIDHPLDPYNKDLIHGFVEAPRYDLIYRGIVQLSEGLAIVKIDEASRMSEGTFDALTQNAEVVALHNKSDFDLVRASEISKGQFTIFCQNTSSNALIHWVVMAERADAFIKNSESTFTDKDGKLIPEHFKPEE